jgi:hypothetical protein
MHSVASGVRNVDALFFMLRWAWCGFQKKLARTRYVELRFLHPVGSVGHVVHYGVSGHEILMHYFLCSGGTSMVSTKSVSGHVISNLCFCIGWD